MSSVDSSYSYIEGTIPIHYDEKFYRETAYHCIDPNYPLKTQMFKVMKSYKYKRGKIVYWILANKSITLNNIRFLEDEGWDIIGIENQCDEIRKCKVLFGADNANIKLSIRKSKNSV